MFRVGLNACQDGTEAFGGARQRQHRLRSAQDQLLVLERQQTVLYSETAEALTEPPEYVALGSTPFDRQKKYRELCDAYLREIGLLNDMPEGADLAAIETEDLESKIAACIRGDPIPF